ncbi:gDSL-like protein [Mycoplasma sp. CAG:472]|nr:gDSL-like protein [Mycoplasma sp. CAG:472]
MKKKKLKLKTKYKFLLIMIAIFLVTFFSMNFLFNIILIGDKDIYLNVNSSYFENGYKATFFGKKLKVDVKNNIDNTSLGDYKVTYTANLLNFKKSVIRNIHVVDNEKPVITLNGDNIIYLNKDSKYEEPGYEITDNYDKDINSKIKVTNNIDETKAGKYEVVYEAIDSSKNKSKVVRTVEVLDDSALTSSIKDFTLKGLFTKTTLTYEENEYNYFNDTIFLGDSNTSFLYLKGKHISAYQTWARNNLNIAQMNSSTFETYENRQNTVLNDALTKYKPKYLIVCPGINAGLYMQKDVFVRELQKFYDNIKLNYKDTKIIFSAIFPINDGTLNKASQKNINILNYYLARFCYENNINFIDFTNEIKDNEGYANVSLFECTDELNCNFHLNEEGRNKYIDYIKHLDLGKVVN